MFLNPIISMCLRPKVLLLKQARGIRPTLRINKEKFQLTIDVHQFDKEEIRVKARPEYVIIEGKQERPTKTGYFIRRFVRKFKLPEGCNPETMKTDLSEEGVLTITAPRKTCSINLPCEKLLSITYSGPKEDSNDIPIIKPDSKDPCGPYRKGQNNDKKAS